MTVLSPAPLRYFDEVETARLAEGREWRRPKLGVLVVHNKLREKAATLPSEVYPINYFAQDCPNRWHAYPWDAIDVDLHEALAAAQEAQEKPLQSPRTATATSGGIPILDGRRAISGGFCHSNAGSGALLASSGGGSSPSLVRSLLSGLNVGSPVHRASCMSKTGSQSSLRALAEEGLNSPAGSSLADSAVLA